MQNDRKANPVGTVYQYIPYNANDDELFFDIGLVPADGRRLKVKDYPEAFEIIGYTFSPDDAKGYFSIPDLRDPMSVILPPAPRSPLFKNTPYIKVISREGMKKLLEAVSHL